MDNIHIVKETILTVEKKPLVLVLPFFGIIKTFLIIVNCE